MKSSSFLGGIFVGAALTVWASRRRAGMLSSMSRAGSALKWTGLKNGKSADMTTSTPHETASALSSNTAGAVNAQVHPSHVTASGKNHSKEYNMKQIVEFIKGNADVRREVEAILKESHIVIPGL